MSKPKNAPTRKHPWAKKPKAKREPQLLQRMVFDMWMHPVWWGRSVPPLLSRTEDLGCRENVVPVRVTIDELPASPKPKARKK